ncbi:pantoate--beta-alanine ligase [Dendrobium catenatum]|uniref:pantoate--beta-alanine ligase n=1 Tax=Dendrobium catenatum TaxID=906689 RepID=UPI0009F335C4|nr:pantoate--beta-alanine ligase [Dendrobium catenatum]
MSTLPYQKRFRPLPPPSGYLLIPLSLFSSQRPTQIEMSEPEVLRDKTLMRSWSRSRRCNGQTIALVPTMGFLHEGHLSLIRTAKSLADLIIVSIYVNPGQFSPSEDLSTYPSDFSGDLRKLSAAGVNVVFCPAELYYSASVKEFGGHQEAINGEREGDSCLEDGGSGHETWIRVERLEKGMCGTSRPVFFRGVATVVAKLFNIVEPDVAVFGKKDYQQWRVICRMVRDLDFAVKVIGSDIIRDVDGLAMSSRNVHLSPTQREKALSINRSLSKAKLAAEKGQKNCQDLKDLIKQTISEAGGKIDYVEIVEQQGLSPVEEISCPVVICVAACFGNVRLIDNLEID